MAETKIQNTFVKSGSFTRAQSGSSPSLMIKQFGQVVVVSGFINSISVTANSTTVLGTLEGVGYPPNTVRCIGSVGGNAYSMGTPSYVAITNTGQIEVTSSNGGSGRALFFSAAYITND